MTDVEALVAQARKRRGDSDMGIGAAAREVTESDRDGQRFEVWLCGDDGNGNVDVFKFDATGPDLTNYTVGEVVEEIERRAVGFPSAKAMVERGAIGLRSKSP